MRNMSFSMTTEQMIDRTKTVTRRYGWAFLEPGDVVMACVKTMGLRKGETVQKMHPIRVLDARWEPLSAMLDHWDWGCDECEREGFPQLTPGQFVGMLYAHSGVDVDEPVRRIEFEHLDEEF